jgi:hypothetical protein
MFRGTRPEGQARSLRTIAESNSPSNFEGATPFVPQSGLPASEPTAAQTYHDAVADGRDVRPTARSTAADPSPFVVHKGG